MIFKRFFKPKWQHADAAVRQQAIAELNRDEQAHKTVLHELAFNDGAEAVRKAALLKLNDFSLWWQASKHDSAERLQQLAEQTLVQQLLDNQVEPKLKQQFIAQCNRSSILEQLAQTETDSALKFSLLQRLNKTELNIKALQDAVLSTAQKLQLLAPINDEKTLEKLSKQLTGELQLAAEQKLQQLAEAKQKPQQLRKQLTLLLAKLNALRERVNLNELPAQFDDYQQQWQQLEPELGCLGTEADEFRAKYTKICQLTAQWLAPRLDELAKAQALEATKAAQQQAQQQLSAELTGVEQQLQQALLAADITAAQQLETALGAIQNRLSQSDVSDKTALQRRLTQLGAQLSQLPKLAEQLTQLTRIVADWAALPMPSDLAAYQATLSQLQQLQHSWRQHSKALAIAVPDSLKQAQADLAKHWQQLQQQFEGQSEKALRQCRSKLAQYRRLHSAGKFNALFGLFKGIEQDHQQLNAAQQAQLAKDYEFARDTQAELTDLQHYIATPRKQALLAEIQQLPTSIVDNEVHQRAEQVKLARASWNSLGRAAPELDAELNAAFDAACEQAFAPCRAYFAKLDAERAKHREQREAIIAQAQQLASAQLDSKALQQQLSQLKQAWQQAGAVDKQQFNALNQAFNQALKPLSQQLESLWQQGAAARQQLIDKATAALSLAEPNQTAKVLKECQQQWKTLPAAGRKQDQALWQQFRQLCDGFFNARSAQFEQQKQAEQDELQHYESALSAVLAALESAASAAEFDQLQQALQQMDPQGVASQQAVRQVLAKLQLKRQQWQSSQQQQGLQQMFEQLSDPTLTADALPAGYRECFGAGREQQFSREQLTIALEIICDSPSVDTRAELRQQVQLMLLSDKHNQGSALDKHSLLKRWLDYGAVTAAEQGLLARVKALFS